MHVPVPTELRDGVPVYRYRPQPGALAVAVLRMGGEHPAHGRRHIHDFPLLLVAGADVRVVAAGAAVEPAGIEHGSSAVSVLFDPGVLGVDGAAGSWAAHPLMYPFAHGMPNGVMRLRLDDDRKYVWELTIAALESELSGRSAGFERAVVAYLTLLLIDVARLAAPLVEHLRSATDPTLAAVFDIIERRYTEPLSARHVAGEIGLTPGYLTTIVRQHTGRTLVDWITDRRMVAARRLLDESDLPIADVGRRVGYPDPAYFARIFRRQHGVSARRWRNS